MVRFWSYFWVFHRLTSSSLQHSHYRASYDDRTVVKTHGKYTSYFHCSFALQICDFGLAKWKEQDATQTSTGIRRGTVAYMAPEVLKDASCPRTVKYDVYSFGILLWELLSEKKPFENGIDIDYCLLELF